MDWPTVIVASIVGIIFVAIIAHSIVNKKRGKSTCSCGGNCGACGMNCSGDKDKK